MGLRPIVEDLRRRDSLEITHFRPSSCRKPRAEQLDYFDGYRRKLTSKGKWPSLVELIIEQHRLIISYRAGYPYRTEEIPISWTRAGRGWRPWFVCPSCRTRRSFLLSFFAGYRCRHCGEAVYVHDRLSEKKKKKVALRKIYRVFGRDDDHPGSIFRRRHMKLRRYHALKRDAQRRERDLYFNEDLQRWRYPVTRWFAHPEKCSGR